MENELQKWEEEYDAKGPEQRVGWDQGRRIGKSEYNKAYAERNKDILREKRKLRYALNREKYAEKEKIYREKVRRARNRERAYGLSQKDYEALLVKQEGKCKICGDYLGNKLLVDHCHFTKKVRGLLCLRCNSAVGYVRDDPSIAEKVARYLRDAINEALKEGRLDSLAEGSLAKKDV